MKRTVRRRSLPLNRRKRETLKRTIEAYARQKDAFLVRYAHLAFLPYLGPGGRRALRDVLVRAGFKSLYGLQARLWTPALEDALLTSHPAAGQTASVRCAKLPGLPETK